MATVNVYNSGKAIKHKWIYKMENSHIFNEFKPFKKSKKSSADISIKASKLVIFCVLHAHKGTVDPNPTYVV